MLRKFSVFAILILYFLSLESFAQSESISLAGDKIQFSVNAGGDEGDLAAPLQILLLLTLLSVAPAILIMLTAFTRIVIVLSMLRQALAMPSTPPNSVLISFALILTIYVMLPVFEKINDVAIDPYLKKQVSLSSAVDLAKAPIKDFMISQTREKDIVLISELSDSDISYEPQDLDLSILVPAFLLSELQSAFIIGFVIFLPFLMIDLIVASVLMSMGMIMLPPTTISLPIKVLVFVLIEGWSLLAYSLVGSFT
ncbi:flagellar type III secretion system pore protein FliP [Microbulbifer sp. GL-2]|uniref:flagellar type III secretion system pore protein FliP n=1 Tax=Microbulbifer sp. GL-2 TaxID=2591606 RepID=UPI001164D77F|nr:flagellar type III secretion system pore protein FliP [Microbulbifer sp. GL-2]BBM00338.1 hypothetical protein GL2_04120 [Microbulbifer sp. GL-2]